MKLKDARSLTPQAQEALRKRAVRAVLSGMTMTRAANVFGVARGTVSGWMKQYAAEGERGLNRHRRGRPPAPRLSGQRAAALKRAITQHCPDELGLPYALWTREAVGALIRERFGMTLSVWTVGRYLRRFGLTPQKPARRAFEQDPKAVEHWLTQEYPAIRRQVHAEGAEIHWGDEMGLRSDHQAGRSWGKRGQTPVVPGTGKRFRCNVISSLTPRGMLRFRVFEGRFNAPVFIDFMRRLRGSTSQKVFLIVDRYPVHRSKAVKAWLMVSNTPTKFDFSCCRPIAPSTTPGSSSLRTSRPTPSAAAGRATSASSWPTCGGTCVVLSSALSMLNATSWRNRYAMQQPNGGKTERHLFNARSSEYSTA